MHPAVPCGSSLLTAVTAGKAVSHIQNRLKPPGPQSGEMNFVKGQVRNQLFEKVADRVEIQISIIWGVFSAWKDSLALPP